MAERRHTIRYSTFLGLGTYFGVANSDITFETDSSLMASKTVLTSEGWSPDFLWFVDGPLLSGFSLLSTLRGAIV